MTCRSPARSPTTRSSPARPTRIYSVEVRARVTGYLDKVNFQDGTKVKKGDLLFEIDPRPYKAELDRAEATLEQAEAHAERLEQRLPPRQEPARPGRRSAGRSTTATRRLRRGRGRPSGSPRPTATWPSSTSSSPRSPPRSRPAQPPDGRPRQPGQGRRDRADHDRHARPAVRLLRHRRADHAADPPADPAGEDQGASQRRRSPSRSACPTRTRTASSRTRGSSTSRDNRVDPNTGTLRFRAKIDNPEHAAASRPGLFVRVRLPIGEPHPALMVPEQALGDRPGPEERLRASETKDEKGKPTSSRIRRASRAGQGRQAGHGVSSTEAVDVGDVGVLRDGFREVTSGRQARRPGRRRAGCRGSAGHEPGRPASPTWSRPGRRSPRPTRPSTPPTAGQAAGPSTDARPRARPTLGPEPASPTAEGRRSKSAAPAGPCADRGAADRDVPPPG